METDPHPSSSPRKVKFAPKGPKARKKPLLRKREAVDTDDGEDDETNEALLSKVNDHLTRRRPQADNKDSVQVVFQQGVATSSIRTHSVAKESSGNKSDGLGSKDSAANTSQDILYLPSKMGIDQNAQDLENAKVSLSKPKKKTYKEPWDYSHSYYPITLPLRRPYSGDPEVLDQEEFGENGEANYDENTVHSASELGLMEEGGRVKMLLLQFPPDHLPFSQRQASASSKAKEKEIRGSASKASSLKGKEKVDNPMSSTGTNFSKELRRPEPPAAGHMGKMLVYKSGRVKLKLDDVQYDVFPGEGCIFAQNAVAINTSGGDFCALGELTRRGVVMPDIDACLDAEKLILG